jgi:beta-lactamase regulating signal transducer with metallopeptidase domain
MMESLTIQLRPFFEWLLRTTLQASMLICLILLFQVVLRSRLGARWHYFLWLLLLIRMAMPWVPQSRVSMFNLIPQLVPQRQTEYARAEVSDETLESDVEEKNTSESKPVSETGAPPETAESVTVTPVMREGVESQLKPGSFEVTNILPLLWLAGALVLAVYVCAGNFHLWWLVTRERPLTDQDILDLLEDCKPQMGIRTILGLVVSDKVKSPALFGFIRPRLLLPAGMLETLSREELRFVFLHELAHLKRHDIYIGYLSSLLQVLHWFNPLIWLAFYRIRTDRELACDALVLARTKSGQAKDYGRTIVYLLERFSRSQRLPAIAGILETKSQLKRRIKMIARFKKNSYQWSPLAVILIILLACVSLPDARRTKASETSAAKPTPGANIIWATSTRDIDEDGVQDDQAFIDWLVAEGHTVDVRIDYWNELDLNKVDELNAADLVIVSRSSNSSDYDDGDEPILWNSVTTPLILMNGYIVRSSRWRWMDTTTTVSEGYIIMLALDTTHPVFDGVTFEGDNMVICLDNTFGSGTSTFVGSIDVGNGTLIAQTLADYTWIAEWPAGVEFYAGSGQISGGPRMLFVAGTQEVYGPPPTPWGAWNLTAEGKQIFRNAIAYMLPEAPGPVAHWQLDEGSGTIAADSSDNWLDGTVMGDPLWVAGIIGGALELDGVDDYVDCGNPSILDFGTGDFTISAWIKTTDAGGETVFAKGGDQIGGIRYRLFVETTAVKILVDDDINKHDPQGDIPVLDGQWHHLVGMRVGDTLRLYIDGVEDQGVTTHGESTLPATYDLSGTSQHNAYIGAVTDHRDGSLYKFFAGTIDDVRIYDLALSEAEIAAIASGQ